MLKKQEKGSQSIQLQNLENEKVCSFLTEEAAHPLDPAIWNVYNVHWQNRAQLPRDLTQCAGNQAVHQPFQMVRLKSVRHNHHKLLSKSPKENY